MARIADKERRWVYFMGYVYIFVFKTKIINYWSGFISLFFMSSASHLVTSDGAVEFL